MKTEAAERAAFQGATGGRRVPLVARPLRIEDGTVEALKWVALVLMTVDHVNKYLLDAGVPWMFAAGRLALPLFGFVLAYNLARPDALALGLYGRVAARLALFAVVASVPAMALGGLAWGWWPMNVMVTLLVATLCAWLVDVGGGWRIAVAVTVFVVGGSSVEFWWPGIASCVGAWAYCRRPSWVALALWFSAVASLSVINRNLWALAALPLIFAAAHVDLALPRVRYGFYAYFPLHLAGLWFIKAIGT